jgi:tricorn protease
MTRSASSPFPSALCSFAALCAALLVPAATLAAAPPASRQAPVARPATPPMVQDASGFLLYPDVHRDFVVFVYAGDLWRAATTGGEARRLTAFAGQELFPKISLDGQWIAFSAEYSGTRQVWVMPAAGGAPRQLTYAADVGPLPPRGGFDAWVLDWTPDGKILARFNRTPWGDRMGRYFLVDPKGGLEVGLDIPHGGTAAFAPDGGSVIYTPLDREFRTWKRTLGGRAQDLWRYDLKARKSQRLTSYRGTDNFPMWMAGADGKSEDDRIYFTSDRGYTLNLFSIPAAGEQAEAETQARQETRFDDFDVLWPSAGPGAIVFSHGGDLYRFDAATRQAARIPIEVHAELAQTLPRFDDVADNIESANLSPTGKRIALEARGELMTLPAEKGSPRNLSQTEGVRERDPAWSDDGSQLAYLSDATGEYELYVRPAEAGGLPRQLTQGSSSWYYAPRFSPDGRSIALPDRQRKLHVVDVVSGARTLVDSGYREELINFAWSPDSRWLVYERTREDSRLVGLSAYSLDRKEVLRLGDGLTTDYSPAFSADGKYLFFLSNRDYKLSFSAFEFNYLYANATRVYVVALDPKAPALFPLQSDEEKAAEEGKKEEAKKDEGKSEEAKKEEARKPKPPTVLDAGGFVQRTLTLPGVAAGSLATLRVGADAVYFLRFGDDSGRGSLQRYDLKARKEETVMAGVSDFQLSVDGKKLMLRLGEAFHVVNAAPAIAAGTGKVDVSALKLKIDPRREWPQIYEDAWRIARDFFYDPAMHGMDWQAVGARYRALLPRLSQRQDLDFLLGELIGELGAGHTYVRAGEAPKVPREPGGLLGAELRADASGYYQISKIFRGENWDDAWRSPLTEPGIDVREGEFLLAIDGQELKTTDHPYRLLEGKANRQVTLRVSGKPGPAGGRDVVVRTIASEANLRYLDWVQSRMALVDKLSQGRVGYIHLPNTAVEGNRMLQKLFYSQSNKEALIVDDRYNQGGFIPDRMIEYLERTPLAWWGMRDIDSMRTPAFAHGGPKAMLINGFSASGGDALPYFFRLRGLGPLIGSRTWGGLIGLNGGPSFVDGGGVDICTFRIYDAQGNWVVENEGVVPDHEVFDTPESLLDGRDASVEKAVALLLEQLQQTPNVQPRRPAAPDLSPQAWTPPKG